MDRDTLRMVLLVAGVILIAGIYFFEMWRKKRRAARAMPFMLDPGTEEAPASAYRAADLHDEEPPVAARAPVGPGASLPGEFRIDDAPDLPPDGLPGNLPGLHAPPDEAPRTPAPRSRPRAEVGVARVQSRPSAGATAGTTTDADTRALLVFNVMAGEGQRMHGARIAPVFERHGLQLGEDGIFRSPPGIDGQPRYSVLSAVKPGIFDPGDMSDLWIPGIAMFSRVPRGVDPVAAFDELLEDAHSLAEALGGRVCDDQRNQLTAQSVNHQREQLREQARRQSFNRPT